MNETFLRHAMLAFDHAGQALASLVPQAIRGDLEALCRDLGRLASHLLPSDERPADDPAERPSATHRHIDIEG